MISRLLFSSKYQHLKIIYEHPKGINNRFKNSADKWVESLRHPHIKTYWDLFLAQQTQQHELKPKLTEKQQNAIQNIKHAYKPGKSIFTNMITIIKPSRPDDNDMERDVKELSLAKFIAEGRQKMTPVHSLVLHLFGFVILHIILYVVFIHGKQMPKNQRVKVLNAQLLESYHFQRQEADIKRIIERIQLVNGEFEKRLASSKTNK